VNCVGIIFTLEGAPGRARHPDRYLLRPHSNIHRWVLGYVLVPVVLNSGADANLPVRGKPGVRLSSSAGEVSIERS
jgi:hypothetical protein